MYVAVLQGQRGIDKDLPKPAIPGLHRKRVFNSTRKPETLKSIFNSTHKPETLKSVFNSTHKPETLKSEPYILARLVPDSADEAADTGEGINEATDANTCNSKW